MVDVEGEVDFDVGDMQLLPLLPQTKPLPLCSLGGLTEISEDKMVVDEDVAVDVEQWLLLAVNPVWFRDEAEGKQLNDSDVLVKPFDGLDTTNSTLLDEAFGWKMLLQEKDLVYSVLH